MYLVDTSVWIDYFNSKENLPVQLFVEILKNNISFGMTGTIYQEILQGADSDRDFKKLTDYLSTQRFFHPQDECLTYQAGAKIYFDCRKKGITIRSTIDCLIAQIAIEHNLTILHNDKDFEQIKKIRPNLKLASRASS
jgi:predicted nucleic acid-binding protein